MNSEVPRLIQAADDTKPTLPADLARVIYEEPGYQQVSERTQPYAGDNSSVQHASGPELESLGLLPTQAATAVERGSLIEEAEYRSKELEALQKRLERLSKAVSEIICSLGKISRHNILTLIAK